MSELPRTARQIISQLIDQEMFLSVTDDRLSKAGRNAVEANKRPETQRRVTGYLRDLLGVAPVNFQDQLLLLIGPGREPDSVVRVVLATLKAVINSPEMQGVTATHVVACLSIVSAVHSIVPELDEREVRAVIDQVFVERFKLLQLDHPETAVGETDAEVAEFWDVSPAFVGEAQNLVTYLQTTLQTPNVTPQQRVNRYLLTRLFLAKATQPELWAALQANKGAIEAQWAQLSRFYLEVGDDYAMLLDSERRPVKSRQFFVAVKVAQSLGSGLAGGELNARIRLVNEQLYPDTALALNMVKTEMLGAGLAVAQAGYWLKTPVAERFTISLTEAGDDHDD